jgi:polysaccharide biosynthesis/export protein
MICSLLLASLAAGCESSSGGAPGLDSLAAPQSTFAPAGGGRVSADVSRQIDSRFQGLADGPPADPSTYQIGPADVLTIAVFQVPELNMDAEVADNGMISLPLVGAMKVSGKQPEAVGADLASRLRAKYMRSPQVTVSVKTYNSQKVVVSGEVTQPGSVVMTGDTTLLSAIADARGFTDMADKSDVMVFRRANGHKYAARFDVSDIQTGKAADPHLRKGDVVVVDSSDTKTWIKTLLPIVTTVGIFAVLL